jgi:hypothetical protein
VVLLIITAGLCIITGLDLSQYEAPTFSWMEDGILIGICVLAIALSIYFWSKQGERPNPPCKKKVTRFLERILDAKEVALPRTSN